MSNIETKATLNARHNEDKKTKTRNKSQKTKKMSNRYSDKEQILFYKVLEIG